MELTRSEMEIMDVLWETGKPLSRADLLEHTEEKTWKDRQKKPRKTLRRKAPRPHPSERLPGDSIEGRYLPKKRHGNRLPQDCNSAIIPLY